MNNTMSVCALLEDNHAGLSAEIPTVSNRVSYTKGSKLSWFSRGTMITAFCYSFLPRRPFLFLLFFALRLAIASGITWVAVKVKEFSVTRNMMGSLLQKT